jgi:hypothetical protein
LNTVLIPRPEHPTETAPATQSLRHRHRDALRRSQRALPRSWSLFRAGPTRWQLAHHCFASVSP